MSNIINHFKELKENSSTVNAFVYEEFNKQENRYDLKYMTYDEYYNKSLQFAKSIKNINTDGVAIQASNRPEWFIATMGTIMAGKYICGIYNTNGRESVNYIVNDGNCNIVVVESYKLYEANYKSHNDKKTYVILEQTESVPTSTAEKIAPAIYSWDKFLNNNQDCELSLDNFNTNDIISLIYTSGTTGMPKGVEITHKNVMTTLRGVLEKIQIVKGQERIISYLPLSHIAAQMIDIYVQMMHGGTVYFARNDCLKNKESLKFILDLAKPTIFFGVPRVWEKMRESMMEQSEKTFSGIKVLLRPIIMLLKWIHYIYNMYPKLRFLLKIPFMIADLLFSKIRQKLGFNNCRYFLTGAAPISKEVLRYFLELSVPIRNVYGMSETCGIITIADPINTMQGYCGTNISGSNIKIDKETGEICYLGDNVMKGYHNMPEENKKILDDNNYLHTGDIGELCDGQLKITGRLKELIITAGGENIPPVIIEEAIKSRSNHISNIVVIGDNRKYLTALITLNTTKKYDDDIEDNIHHKDHIEFKKISSDINKAIAEYNNRDAISSAQRIQKIKILLNEEFTIENKCMTDTMKIKRKIVHELYKESIENLYRN